MSNYNIRGSWLAIGVVLGVAIAIFIFLIAVPEFSDPFHQVSNNYTSTNHEEHTNNQENQNEPQWWSWISQLFTVQDTIAQWIMAAFGIVATGISVWALLVLQRTLNETEKATKAATNSAQAIYSVERAWFTPVSTNINFYNTFNHMGEILQPAYSFSIMWQNCGRCPATNIQLSFVYRIINQGEDAPVIEFDDMTEQSGNGAIVGPNGEISTRHISPFSRQDMIDFQFHRRILYARFRIDYFFTIDTGSILRSTNVLLRFGIHSNIASLENPSEFTVTFSIEEAEVI